MRRGGERGGCKRKEREGGIDDDDDDDDDDGDGDNDDTPQEKKHTHTQKPTTKSIQSKDSSHSEHTTNSYNIAREQFFGIDSFVKER